eukprot:s3340_g6.t1
MTEDAQTQLTNAGSSDPGPSETPPTRARILGLGLGESQAKYLRNGQAEGRKGNGKTPGRISDPSARKDTRAGPRTRPRARPKEPRRRTLARNPWNEEELMAHRAKKYQALLHMLATMVLRQEAQFLIQKQDTSFVIFMQTHLDHSVAIRRLG